MPGVLAVLTGADAKSDGLKAIPHTPIPMKPPADILLVNRDGSAHGYAPHDALPADRVRYVGEQVAMVIAETINAAKDAAEAVVVTYDELPVVTKTADAAEADAPQLYDDVKNVCIDADVGDVDVAGIGQVAELGNLAFQLGDRLLEFQGGRTHVSSRARVGRAPRRAARGVRSGPGWPGTA